MLSILSFPFRESFLLPLFFYFVLKNHTQLIQIIISSFLVYCNFCTSQMPQPVPEHIRTIKYKITATIHEVKISKKGKFFTKVQWKRHQNEASTNLVLHQNQLSIFNEALELEYSFHYDTEQNMYLEKKCDMIVIVDLNGDGEAIKNGGYARFDLSEPINDSQQSKRSCNSAATKKMNLLKNPDSNAYIQFSLLYEPIEQTYPLEMSMTASTTSIPTSEISASSELKTTSKTEIDSDGQPNLVTDFRQQGLNTVVNKFQLLAMEIKNKIKDKQARVKQRRSSYQSMYAGRELPEGMMEMEEEIRLLRETQQRLESQLEYAEDEKKDLEKLLDKKSKQIITKTHEIYELSNRIQNLTKQRSRSQRSSSQHVENISLDNGDQKEQQYHTLKQKFESQQQQLSELKAKLASYESKSHKQKSIIDNFYGLNRSSSTISMTEDNRVNLEKQLANKCHQIGELFNAAFEIGGAPLLDKLQSAIGLVEFVQN